MELRHYLLDAISLSAFPIEIPTKLNCILWGRQLGYLRPYARPHGVIR